MIGTHTYAEEGSQSVSVKISDQYGIFAKVSDTMSVADAPISATGTPLAVTEGQAYFGVVAHFTDADPAGALSDYWATIDWGDGNFSQGTIVTHSGGGFDVTGTDTYAGRGPYTTTVQIHDQGGSVATVNGAVTVTVPLPFVSIVATQAERQCERRDRVVHREPDG